jgi:hypothetical protein
MSELHPSNNDEIDLFKVLETLWSSKQFIFLFVAIAVLLGAISIFTTDGFNKYESKLFYSANATPPFFLKDKALTDFQKMLYSEKLFEAWKKNNSSTSLEFKVFSETQFVDGFVLSKDKSEQMMTIESTKEGVFYIYAKSNQLTILNDIYLYSQHINELLTTEYISRTKDEFNIIETRFKDFSTANDAIISEILKMDRYIVTAESGVNALTIQHPTKPEVVKPTPLSILALSSILGGVLGATFILLRNAIRNRKKN